MAIQLDDQMIETIIRSVPTSFGLYQVDERHLYKLYNSVDLKTPLGFTEEEYEEIVKNPLLLMSEKDQELYWNDIQSVIHDLDQYADVENTIMMIRNNGPRIPVISHIRYLGVYQELPVIIAIFTLDWDSERAFLEQEHNLKDLYEAALQETGLVVWEYDIVHHRILIPRHLNEHSFTAAAHIPRVVNDVPYSLTKYFEDNSVDDFVRMYQAIDEGEASASCEVWIKGTGDMAPACLHMALTTLYDDNGFPTRAFGVGEDITVYKKEEDLYNAINRQFETMLSVSMISARLNLTDNKVIRFMSNEAHIQAFPNMTAEDFFYWSSIYIDDDEVQRVFEDTFKCDRLIDLFNKNQNQVNIQIPVRYRDNNIHYIDFALIMSMNPQTKSIEALVYTVDNTDQVIRQQTIYELSETRFYFIANLSLQSEMIQVLSRDETAGIEENERRNYDDFIDERCHKFIEPHNRAHFRERSSLETIREQLAHNETYTFMIEQKVSGEIRYLQETISYLDESHEMVLLTCIDVTEIQLEQQRVVERMQEALLTAERANDAKTNFLSRISHDIRTPIGIISNMTDFAINDADDKEQLLQDLKKIKSADTFLLSLINDVLDISKIDSGKIELKAEKHSLNHLYENIYHMIEALCESRGLRFEAEKRGDVDEVYIDTVRYNQITLNLLSNAANYTGTGGKLTYICESQRVDNQHVKIKSTVKDTGIGMSKEFQAHMFEAFAQEGNHPLRNGEDTGTGLGLAIVKGLIDLMNGTIEVESEVGKGTSITWEIIIKSDENQKMIAEAPVGTSMEPLYGRILLVEDNALNREIALRIMEQFGLQVETANDGLEGLQRFGASPLHYFDLIVMDLQMPVMDGYQSTQLIRQLQRIDAKTIPIVAMSADVFSEAIQQGIESGMTDYLTKPLDVERFYNTLKKYLSSEN